MHVVDVYTHSREVPVNDLPRFVLRGTSVSRKRLRLHAQLEVLEP